MKEIIKSNKGFYVGDICYVLNEKIYHKVWGGNGYVDGKHTIPQTNWAFAVAGTKYGDGEYVDNELRFYGVDAGVIGLVPAELIKPDYDLGGHIFECSGDATFEANNGIFVVSLPNGKVIKINTAH